ncbi:MAG: DNA repair protein RecN [Pseudobacteriovorax sp.]|nr:DNA repair protein RecN [Pseudobacteriovorax sp.]
MLSHLLIKGLAIIEELEIEFNSKLNVITGETGAGKSILIKALDLVLGGKSNSDVVRQGWKSASVSAVFLFDRGHPFVGIAGAHGIELDDGQFIIRRKISVKGRSQAWINDNPVTISTLKRIGSYLIDIFGQHDNHRLLNPANHIAYLDQFVSEDILGSYVDAYKDLTRLARAIVSDRRDFHRKHRDLDYMTFRYEEILTFGPDEQEFVDLTESVGNSKSDLEAKQLLLEARNRIDGQSDEGLSITSYLGVKRILEKVKHDGMLDRAIELCDEVTALKDELSFEVERYLSQLDVDSESIERKQERLSAYHALFHKMRARDIHEFLMIFEQLGHDINFVKEAEINFEKSLTEFENLLEVLIARDSALNKSRDKAFQLVSKRISRELNQLNMKGAEIFVDKSPYKKGESDDPSLVESLDSRLVALMQEFERFGPDGSNSIQFLLKSNPGEEAKPLSKIASGGEVSRIMLGIKKVLSADARTCVMVFDEIDTGISGHTASIVGKKLLEISKVFQVICVSHLPQVAVYGNTHLKVEKTVKKGRTESNITRLSKNEALNEIARLLSGGQITKSSLQNARSLRKESLEKSASV